MMRISWSMQARIISTGNLMVLRKLLIMMLLSPVMGRLIMCLMEYLTGCMKKKFLV